MGDRDKQVIDDEGSVDQQLKNEIIRARRRVAEREDDIFTRARLEGLDAPKAELVSIWKTPVRQYLRRIEPLLTSDEIDDAPHYYKEIQIASDVVHPVSGPTKVLVDNESAYQSVNDGVANLPWGMLYEDHIQTAEYDDLHKLFSSRMQVPALKEYTVNGLLSVINGASRNYGWRVSLNNAINPANQVVALPQVPRSLQKQELEQAVRLADQFLQHHAGIGMTIETPGMDTWGFKEVEEDAE